MKLAGTLVKSGLAVAGAGIYLFFRKLFKGKKKTKKTVAKNKPTRTTKKQAVKPRQKKLQEPEMNVLSK